MILRKKFLPNTLSDIIGTLFLSVCIPITFWFEMFVVVPEFHSPGSFLYNMTFVVAVFLLVNVEANMLAVMLYDTSIRGRTLTPPEDSDKKKSWRLCSVCGTLVPPRSWHCNICKTCILKRDHHCMFTGCCVGHDNHRFFIALILFMFVGSTYSSIYNNIFIWCKHADIYSNSITILKMTMPLLMFTLEVSSGNAHLVIYELNLIAAVISGMLLVYHGRIILRGGVVHEKKSPNYDLGWKQNLKLIFGKRWYLVWILPFIESELLHDGVHWEKNGLDSPKNK